MFIEREHLADAAATQWHTIVIGAGPVGLVLAVSLARAGKQVLVLESGGKDPGDAKDLNDAVLTGRPHAGALHGRARTIGGTSTLWGGQLTRFVPYDFETRPFMTECRWPLRFEDVAPYYVEVAEMLGLDARYLDDDSVLKQLHAPVGDSAAGCEMFFTRWLREAHLGRYFAKELAGHELLGVVPQCHARQILVVSGSAEVRGVKAISARGEELVFQAKNVVLACGTIEISRLLLLSAYRDASVPWAANDNIGRYFQDHLDLTIGQIELKDRKSFANLFENAVIDGHKYQPKVRMKGQVLRSLECLNLACTVRFDSAIAEDIQMLKQMIKSLLTGSRVNKPWQSLKRMAALSHVWFPLMWRYLRHRRILALADRGISVIAHCEQRPVRNSRVSLDGVKTDKFGDPLARLHWVVDEALQLKSLKLFISQLQEFFRTQCAAEFKPEPALQSGDPAALAAASDSYHQCGGACMADSAAQGVVDQDCRVFGTSNLYVAGAAVFPTSSFANPTFTAMALARRLGRRLLLVEGNA
jgi:choline dehydrogenase-like flavoprotein